MTDIHALQIALEEQQVSLGQARYADAVDRQEETETDPGKLLTRQYLKPVADKILDFMLACAMGAADRKATAYKYLLHVDPLQAAYLAVRAAFNGAADGGTLTGTAKSLSVSVEDHINFETMRETNKGLYEITLRNMVAHYSNAKRRNEAYKRQFKKYGIETLRWTEEERILLGTKLIELVEQATGVIQITRETEGKHRTVYRLSFVEGAVEWLKSAHARAALLSPVYLPMLVPPRPWTGPLNGGYLTPAVRSWMIRVRKKDDLSDYEGTEMPEVYAAINAVQATPWRFNGAVLRTLRAAWEAGDTLGGLPPAPLSADEIEAGMPPRPAHIPADAAEDSLTEDQREDLKAYKRARAQWHGECAERRVAWFTVARKLGLVDRFDAAADVLAQGREFYFPYFLDFRGRLYPFCEALNPQGDDLSKALLEFAHGEPLGEDGAYWLAVHLANNYANGGLDKLPLDERVAWVHANEEKILESAANPLDGARFWTTAENPWMFLAACFEWAGYRVQGDSYVSHLPVNMDGSCSGLQHYSAMLRDPVGGAAVNLVPAERANDIYTRVAGRAQALSDGCTDAEKASMWRGKVTRKVAKQPTMTMCYAVTKVGVRKQIQKRIAEYDAEAGSKGSYLGTDDSYAAAAYMADKVWEAIGDVVVAARQGMDFLKKCASAASKTDNPLRWTTPVGFVVNQAYMEAVGERLKVHYNGQRIDLVIEKDGEKIDSRSQSSAVAPNFVHSMDAAHLMNTVNLGVDNGIHSWSVIHDSFGTHAGKVSLLNAVLRESFVQQYSVDRLAMFRAEIAAQLEAAGAHDFDLPEVPPMGDLDIEAVRHSEFFFA